MGKVARIVEGRTKEQRAKVRKSLGTLKQLTVQPQTRARYISARKKFYAFLEHYSIPIPKKREKLDLLLGEYLEHLWSSGEGRGLASDTVAGLQDLDPHLKRHLSCTWRLLKAWHLNEVPNRAPPLPETALKAMVGWAIFHQHHSFALSLLIGFFGLLRTGEIHGVRSDQVYMAGPKQAAVISLGLTKSGKRAGAAESVTIHVYEVLRRLFHWKRSASPREHLVSSPSKWRTLFNHCLTDLSLEEFSFRPYSLRRGGSTFWFHKHGSFDKLLVAGRWQASKTARVYLNEGLAMMAELKMPSKVLKPYLTVYTNSLQAELPKNLSKLWELDRGTWNRDFLRDF